MARPVKQGLDYFPMDVDIFDDDKLIAVAVKFGAMGELLAVKLLCAIYREGYYLMWQERLKLKMMRCMPGITEDFLEQVVDTLVQYGLFDKTLFQSDGVLTSKGIQTRYFTSKRRKTTDDLPYILLSRDGKMTVSAAQTPVSAAQTRVIAAKSAQSKEKKNKEKENKENTLSTVSPRNPLREETTGRRLQESEREKDFSLDFDAFQQCWNAMLQSYNSKISQLTHMTESRKAALQDLLDKGYSKTDMTKVMRAAASSPQLNGRGKKGFIPGFDWIMREENFVRVLEGEFNAKFI